MRVGAAGGPRRLHPPQQQHLQAGVASSRREKKKTEARDQTKSGVLRVFNILTMLLVLQTGWLRNIRAELSVSLVGRRI